MVEESSHLRKLVFIVLSHTHTQTHTFSRHAAGDMFSLSNLIDYLGIHATICTRQKTLCLPYEGTFLKKSSNAKAHYSYLALSLHSLLTLYL